MDTMVTDLAIKPPSLEQQARKWDSVDLELVHEGEKIILPAKPFPMNIKHAIKQLQKIEAAQEMEYTINETVQCHFFDGLVAFARALKEKYGYSMAVPTPGFFGGTLPKFIHVKTGPDVNDVVQVPVGSFKLPNIEGTLQTKYGLSRGIPVFQIAGVVKAREKHIVQELVALTTHISRTQSIYKGRSIILDRDESGGIDFNEQLQFFNPHIGYEIPIFDTDTENLIETALMAPISRAADCRRLKIPLKRGVLLEGPYGTGKTLVAKQVAKETEKHGWTFITVTSSSALKYALAFAKMYQPCVVFAEDMDRVAGNRNDAANNLINDIDGVVSKTDEIITVVTTNHAQNIEKAFLRPGRLDCVISLRPPENEAVERLVRYYAGPLLNKNEKLDKCMPLIRGQIPATIREVVERSKLAMIYNNRTVITDGDLYVSAFGMQNHLRLIDEASENKRDEDAVGEAISKIVDKALKPIKEAVS